MRIAAAHSNGPGTRLHVIPSHLVRYLMEDAPGAFHESTQPGSICRQFPLLPALALKTVTETRSLMVQNFVSWPVAPSGKWFVTSACQ